MKKHPFITFVIAVSLAASPQLFATHSPSHSRSAQSLFTEEEEESEDAGPSEAIIRKLAAMSPDQTFKRDGTKESDGKIAPKDATLYIVDINDKDGKLLFKTFFFKGENGKWSLFDEAGNVMHET